MANDAGSATTAPYGPWQSFETWLKGFKGKPVPRRIEGNLFAGFSGSGQSQIRGALRFFGMVRGDRDEVVSESFTLLVNAVGTDNWSHVLSKLLPHAYGQIMGAVDMENGTEGQLREAFEQHGGVRGESNRKARRFFLTALGVAGIPYSPFFSPDGGQASNGTTTSSQPRQRRRPRSRASDPPVTMPAPALPDGMEEVSFSMPDRADTKLTMPSDLDAAEEDYLLDSLTRYFALRRKKRGEATP